jgi:hypothetical protein
MLRDPRRLASLTSVEFSRLIDVAEQTRLLGWLLSEVEARQLPRDAPPWLEDRLQAARALAREHERAVRWEIDRLQRALSGAGLPWVLLKGAAYLTSALPPGRGRHVADIDVLVPIEQLPSAERALNAHGWRVDALDAYDERYYREWMHELPPMVHEERGSVVDVHHAILPRTSRLQPATPRLIAQAREVDGGLKVLSPAHMALHAAAHLFHDGEIAGAIRDAADLDRLFRSFAADPGFWAELLREASELGLTRPAYYALRYAARFMGTPIPQTVTAETSAWAPPRAILALMDAVVERALPGRLLRTSKPAAFALYVRSHWLRMPPTLLARHLLRKSFSRQ